MALETNDQVLQAMDQAQDAEGMEDLGTAIRDTVAIRVKGNGQVVHQKDWVSDDGPGLEAWGFLVRYALAHQATHEVLTEEDGKASPLLVDGPTLKDGRPITLKNLEGLHPKTLATLAKEYQVDPKGKTTKVLAAEIMARVNTEE